ncbi:MAG: hypothetical protein JXR83_10705 [Deltaproteobacteria bacterium]|nr:hypothetical protein [Deltaproteobacteria bacterium]
MSHQPITRAVIGEPIEIRTTITDQSGVFEARLHYRLAGGGEFLSASLVKTTGDEYVASIPAGAVTGDIEYFLEAFDIHGNGPALVGSQPKPLRIAVAAAAASSSDAGVTGSDAGTINSDSTDAGSSGGLPDIGSGSGQTEDGEGDGTGLVIAVVASGVAAVVVAGAVIGVVIYALSQEPEAPGTVTLRVTAPPPVQAPLGNAP